jgi:hypothetical protein
VGPPAVLVPGEHSMQILEEFGIKPDAVDILKKKGVISAKL